MKTIKQFSQKQLLLNQIESDRQAIEKERFYGYYQEVEDRIEELKRLKDKYNKVKEI